MLSWANQFNICCFLDNNNYPSRHNSYECLLAVGSVNTFVALAANHQTLNDLKAFVNTTNDWLFGHIAYDFKNAIYPLTTKHKSNISFPEAVLFQPEIIVKIVTETVTIESLTIEPHKVLQAIEATPIDVENKEPSNVNIQPKISRQDYIEAIKKIKQHIQAGDCYELNFCQEFFAENTTINPLEVYLKLNKISPTPFSCFYKFDDNYLLCASPERYVKKIGNTIISQPIKGTAKRNLVDSEKDEALKKALQQSQKETSENVMIVDLVRNDLSKIATKASVKVDELFGVYSFPQVHQMISTVSANLKDNTDVADMLKATFPMGSMTGAPKYKVMQLIEEYEQSKRGVYSGCVGYISPQKEYDFNVVIRSIMYNETAEYVSYQVGGAITHYCNAEDEYEECLLKAKAMEAALQ